MAVAAVTGPPLLLPTRRWRPPSLSSLVSEPQSHRSGQTRWRLLLRPVAAVVMRGRCARLMCWGLLTWKVAAAREPSTAGHLVGPAGLKHRPPTWVPLPLPQPLPLVAQSGSEREAARSRSRWVAQGRPEHPAGMLSPVLALSGWTRRYGDAQPLACCC